MYVVYLNNEVIGKLSKNQTLRGSTCEGTTRGKLKKIRQYP